MQTEFGRRRPLYGPKGRMPAGNRPPTSLQGRCSRRRRHTAEHGGHVSGGPWTARSEPMCDGPERTMCGPCGQRAQVTGLSVYRSTGGRAQDGAMGFEVTLADESTEWVDGADSY